MRTILIAALCLLLLHDLNAQILKGTIKDVEGEPIPYATVYIQELKQGTTANTKGDYELRLPDGKYTVIYQSLGFEPNFRDITMKGNTVTANIVLQVQYYEIPEVRITASGEDPAYGIMRKVIGMAPYYLNHTGYYKADVYIKGNLLLNKIPKIIQRQMKVEARNSSTGSSASSTTMKEGDSYMMESFNEIEFNAPDKYVQRVISSRSTFPEQGETVSPMELIQASFYEPVIANMFISPLSPEAFSHYKFIYNGLSAQGNYIINKIQVIPKRKSQQLFEGTIYIIEDMWCLHSVDLVNENIAGKIRIQQLYVAVQEDLWMPVSHKFDMNIAILGVRADAGYSSSIKYREVKINQNLARPKGIGSDYTGNLTRPKTPGAADTVALTKTTEQIEKLLSKDELNNRDMAKLSNLLEKQTKESLPDSVKNNLEIKDKTTYIIEKDANKKDSSYWTGIRPIPLSENELKSIRVSDSIMAKLVVKEAGPDSTGNVVKKKPTFMTRVKNIAFGHTWSDTMGFRFTNGGLIDLKNLSFNTVDGFVYGIDFRISKTWNKKNTLSLFPDVRYAFSRHSLMWRLNGQYMFNGLKPKQVFFRAGLTSKDINSQGSINTFLNTITTLGLELNYLKLYESGYFTLGYRSEITNGLSLAFSAGLEQRRVLDNTTDFSIIDLDRNYSDNIPDNPYLDIPANIYHGMQDHNHADINALVIYTPRMKYTIRNNLKFPRGSDWPTFTLGWKHGINRYTELSNIVKHYDQYSFSANQRKDIGAFSEFRWRFRSGGFINNSALNFLDFNSFNAQPLIVLLNDYEDAFMLPRYYSMSNPEFFTEFHVKYTTPYLLLKLLPGISKTLMRENLSISFLWSDYHPAYTEIGYSLSEFLFVGELGVYVGFDNLRYNSIGGKVVLRFN